MKSPNQAQQRPQEQAQEFSFMDEMKGVTPLVQDKAPGIAKPQKTLAQSLKRQALEKEQDRARNYLSVESVDPVDPHDPIHYKKPGVQDGVYRNLRLGKYRIDKVLHIQKCSVDQARELVFETILNAQKQGVRTLLINHGLGLHSRPFPAAMKSYLHRWLQQMPEVLAYHTATRPHGGLAAAYVMLKKHPDLKLHNKEMQRKS